MPKFWQNNLYRLSRNCI